MVNRRTLPRLAWPTPIWPYAGSSLFNIKKVVSSPVTDLDTGLNIDELEIEDLIKVFFAQFNVFRGNFNIEIYYSAAPPAAMACQAGKKAKVRCTACGDEEHIALSAG